MTDFQGLLIKESKLLTKEVFRVGFENFIIKSNKYTSPEISRKVRDADYRIVIPVCGRLDSAKTVASSLKAAFKGRSFSICFSEISDSPIYSDFCEQSGYDYIYQKNSHLLFNKSLAMNIAAREFESCKWFLFHDVDCVVKSDFFDNLLKNVEVKRTDAIQSFYGRRVLYIDEHLSKLVKDGSFDVQELSLDSHHISEPINFGAPGGSIFIKSDLFFKVGGYDDELFWGNAPEDAFFWHKVDFLSKMEISDNPPIDVFHLFHNPTESINLGSCFMIALFDHFKSLSEKEKRNYIEAKFKKITSNKNV